MELINGTYRIQGLDVASIAKEFGTPLYLYDGDKIVSQLQTLKSAFTESPVKIKYAAKALTNISILKLMKKHGAGVDVVSIQEAHLALSAGFTKEEIMFTPNCVDFSEIEAGVNLGLQINLDNLPMLEKFGQKYGSVYPCCLRLNPSIMAGGNYKISTGHSHSKFGISILQMDQIQKLIREFKINVNGLHIHLGSEIKDADVFMKMADVLFDVAKNFPDLQFIDYGGGFKVAYKEDDHITNIAELGQRLSKAFNEFCQRYGRQLDIWVEPGKYLVSECGYLLVNANVVKETPAVTFVGVDSGLNHLIRPMMYDAYHEIVNLSNPGAPKKTYTVVGNICETDTLGADRQLNEVREGDLLSIENAGAYGFSMSSNYNSRLRPAEVLVWKGKAQLIRKRETFDDLIKNQIIVEI
jgi:diaminopimelate decarboxylase